MSEPHIACPWAFRSSRKACSSSDRGGRISAITEDLLVDDDLVQHAHARTLVQPRGARRALGVDLEGDRVLAAVEERPERAPQQRLSDAAAAPDRADAEALDPAPLAVSLPVAQREARDLVPVGGDEVE